MNSEFSREVWDQDQDGYWYPIQEEDTDWETELGNVSVSSRGAKPRERETGSLQVAYSMRLVLLNVSLHVLVIKSLQETQ